MHSPPPRPKPGLQLNETWNVINYDRSIPPLPIVTWLVCPTSWPFSGNLSHLAQTWPSRSEQLSAFKTVLIKCMVIERQMGKRIGLRTHVLYFSIRNFRGLRLSLYWYAVWSLPVARYPLIRMGESTIRLEWPLDLRPWEIWASLVVLLEFEIRTEIRGEIYESNDILWDLSCTTPESVRRYLHTNPQCRGIAKCKNFTSLLYTTCA